MARIILAVTNNNTGRISYQGVRHEGEYEDMWQLFQKYIKMATAIGGVDMERHGERRTRGIAIYLDMHTRLH